MAGKSNIRSMRFSDEIIEMIEAQVGDTFTQKFENLVTRCVWELPKKEQELKEIQERIAHERNNLRYVQDTKRKLEQNIRDLNYSLENVQRQVKRVTEALEKIES